MENQMANKLDSLRVHENFIEIRMAMVFPSDFPQNQWLRMTIEKNVIIIKIISVYFREVNWVNNRDRIFLE